MTQFARNVGALIIAAFGIDIPTVTAGTGADGLAVNGEAIDRIDAHSCSLAVQADVALTASETLAVTVAVEDSADGTSFAAAPTSVQPTAAVLTATATGKSAAKLDVDLSACRRYVRFVVTPTLSLNATDTAKVAAICILGGRTIKRGA